MVYVIAEAGVNHDGSFKDAKRLIKEAKKAGADAIKFQTFKADNLVRKTSPKAEYQRKERFRESQYEMLKRLELSFNDFKKLKEYAESMSIDFMSTPFDIESLEFLVSIGVKKLKISSGEITNKPLLQKVASKKLPTILSTGMSDLKDVNNAVNILKKNGLNLNKLTILHCNTDYPSNFQDINLNAMDTISKKFGVKVGYSDHTLGSEVALGAVALGASVIEKHFTLDKNRMGPDHSASLNPEELKKFVTSLKNLKIALGDSRKKPSMSEIKNIIPSRKSIVAQKSIKKGEIFSEENLTCKRPAKGISPMHWNKIIGRKSDKNYKINDYIKLNK